VSQDPLEALRQAVDTIDEVAIGDRLAVFEEVNDQLAAELAALDEL
jgi:hypothetical protein